MFVKIRITEEGVIQALGLVRISITLWIIKKKKKPPNGGF